MHVGWLSRHQFCSHQGSKCGWPTTRPQPPPSEPPSLLAPLVSSLPSSPITFLTSCCSLGPGSPSSCHHWHVGKHRKITEAVLLWGETSTVAWKFGKGNKCLGKEILAANSIEVYIFTGVIDFWKVIAEPYMVWLVMLTSGVKCVWDPQVRERWFSPYHTS